MLKKLSVIVSVLISAGSLFAVQIDTALLDTATRPDYIEDTSPVPKNEFNSAKQIRDMGRRLGGSIKRQDAQHKSGEHYASGAPSKKYRAHRVPSSDSLPGADIIYIAPNAKVGTIKALAFILSGYIEAAYDLPLNEADTLAQKVCWWNTNHYDDRNYFTKHFNARILESFSDETAVIGLADSYKNWAGHARIVIPFEKIKDTQTAAKDGTKQSAKIDSKNKDAQKNSDVEKNTAQNKKEDAGKGAAQNDADKNAAGTMRNTLRKEALQFKTVPANYKILFGALCLAALLIIVLLVRVIIDMARN
ncbi:P83/100 family protein [Treponema sp. Marseille-Q4132]|uniref:P83/100 family protein n=1 Tax=Treponema sp. Marseille-Q4132 TaxID=2766701 RepID=UPI0016531472|nr:P83/100 family protein [Treponema sp. Marseille-Q4132]QNL97784.1 hypothetical protein H9I35_03245 [Treponema sp. Marseille-Q4132]